MITSNPSDNWRAEPASVSACATIGPGCNISTSAYVGAGVVLERAVVIGPNVSVLGQENEGVPTTLYAEAVVGAGSVIYAGVTIGSGALVRPGTVVTRSVPPGAIVEGNPATIVGYVDAERKDDHPVQSIARAEHTQIEQTPVKNVTVHHFPVIQDLRGNLTVGEFEKQIPFIPRRYFMVFGVPNREVRGEHAHYACHQFLICVRGSCAVVADDGVKRFEVNLDGPQKGLYLPPMTWGIQYKYSSDALLLVFASHYYESGDYIRNYDEFLAEVKKSKP
jgi:UDP-2-acetamido-3-amino-2,3-dideoxy-glucuronate N-acetyltransferase